MIPSPRGERWDAMKGVAPMTTTKRALWFGVAAVAIAVLYAGSVARLDAQQPGGAAVSIDADDIGGVVTGPSGPEAGVWVIAEAIVLPPPFARPVVPDDHVRAVELDLPQDQS